MSDFEPTKDVSDLSEYKLGELLESDSKDDQKKIILKDENIDKFEEDFEMARETIVNILENADGVIQGMMELAKESDSPRAYEVLSTMMNNFISSSKELVDLHEKKAKIKEKSGNKDAPGVQNNTQNNIVFNGSPNDLLREFKNEK